MRMNVPNREQAWKEVSKLFPTDYEKDETASLRAGYDIYTSPTLHYCRICDLGSRLEVTTNDFGKNKTINIWIENERGESSMNDIAKEMIQELRDIQKELAKYLVKAPGDVEGINSYIRIGEVLTRLGVKLQA